MLRSPTALLLAAVACAAAIAVVVTLVVGDTDGRGEAVDAAALHTDDFAGLVSEDVIAGNARYRDRTLERERRVGVRLIRQTFDWASIEKKRSRYSLARYDRFVAKLAEHGIRVLPVLFDPPPFRSGAPAHGAAHGTYPPRRYADLGTFGAVLARRYGPNGSLWAQHPEISKLPIRSWQVWNEPNFPAYWPSGPNPAEYAALLKATARGIRSVDPQAEIVTAGVANTTKGIPFDQFAEGLYDAGASNDFDTFALHPYARDAAGTLDAVEASRALIARHGDDAPIWITELGWATGGPPSPFTVSQRGQADRVRQTFSELRARRRELGVRGIVYFNWQDARPSPGRKDFWGFHTGLLTIDGKPKPALQAFDRAMQGDSTTK